MAGDEVIIVGGGILGAATAFELASRGAAPTLLEKRGIASGPTGRSCGIVRQHYSHEVTAGMALRAVEVFENFDEVVGGDCDFHRTGFLLAVGPDRVDTLRANVALQQRVGIETRLVKPSEVAELVPGVDPEGFTLAAWESRAGYADAHATTMSYASRARDLGAAIHTGVEVTGLRVEGGRVRGVETADGSRHDADAVVLATGPWAAAMLRPHGIELPIVPSRVQVGLFQPAPGFEPSCVFVDAPQGFYSRPESGPLLLVGSIETREGEGNVTDPDRYDESIDQERVERYSERVMRRIPAMAAGHFHAGYASLYDVTPDWQPILDRVPGLDGLFCAAGTSGHGFKLAPVIGEMMARQVLGESEPEPLFAYSRFGDSITQVAGYSEHKILG